MSDGDGYGPREATLVDFELAHAALEALPANDPHWQAAWDQAFAAGRSYFGSVRRGGERRQAAGAETQQDALWGHPDPEAGQ